MASFCEEKVDFIVAGNDHMLAIANGTLYSWGQNNHGQLGIGTYEDAQLPVKVGGREIFNSDVRTASASAEHSLVLTEDRRLWAFGNGQFGRLGLGHITFLMNIKVPRLVESHHFGGSRISVIAAGHYHSGALTEDGKLYTWGAGTGGLFPPLISALAHNTRIRTQQVPVEVQRRSPVTRSAGEQFPFGVFVPLPDDHVLAFMMGTQAKGTAAKGNAAKGNAAKGKAAKGKAAKGKAAKGKAAKGKAAKGTFTMNDIPDTVLRMITEMARTHVLPTVYDKLRGVRKLMGDSSA
jgi:alpha-tubulin suppressor-like RCC1 family protein